MFIKNLIWRTKPQLDRYIINIKGFGYCKGNISINIEEEISRHLDEYDIKKLINVYGAACQMKYLHQGTMYRDW